MFDVLALRQDDGVPRIGWCLCWYHGAIVGVVLCWLREAAVDPVMPDYRRRSTVVDQPCKPSGHPLLISSPQVVL